VTGVVEQHGDPGADPAAAHDHDLHE